MSSAGVRSFICVVILGLLCLVSGAGTTRGSGRVARKNLQRDAIQRLSQVFEIEKLPMHRHHRTPPQYMSDMYGNVAYSDGISKKANPFDADTVRSFPDRDTSSQMHFFFNISNVMTRERILRAELHLFKLRSRLAISQAARDKAVHIIDLRLYQVLNESGLYSMDGLLFLAQRRISAHRHGWQVFNVTDTVQQWRNDSTTNCGFFLTATSLAGDHVNGSFVRFAQRGQHHNSKQPGVVVFTDEQQFNIATDELDWVFDNDDEEEEEVHAIRHSNYVRFLNEQHRAEHGAMPVHRRRRNRNYMSARAHQALISGQRAAAMYQRGSTQQTTGRNRRAAGSRRRRKSCSRHTLYVDFVEIGWSGWIISPRGYNAYHCKGSCPFPLGQNQKPTNHATVQSIAYTLNIGTDLGMPCCVPDKLYSISLLYYDDDENVILKQYDEMVAASCGCH